MIYALRKYPTLRFSLVEFSGTKAMRACALTSPELVYSQVTASVAHQWVKDRKEHETGLYIDLDGNIRYARAE